MMAENNPQVFQNQYNTFPLRYKENLNMNFKQWDLMRLSKLREVFDKKKHEQSYKVLTVSECVPRLPRVQNWKIMMENLSKTHFTRQSYKK